MKQTILKFIQKINTSDCAFLRDFSNYLKDCCNGDEFEEKPVNDKRMEILSVFIDDIYSLPKMPQQFIQKGCALLGETSFNKLDFTKAFLESYGGAEYTDDDITKNRYVVIDCERKAKKSETLLALARKYKNVPFVIFDNCENILRNIDNLVLFKHLSKDDRKISCLDPNDDFIVKSWYIFLGNENKLPELMKKANAVALGFQYKISAFSDYIHINNFDAKGS